MQIKGFSYRTEGLLNILTNRLSKNSGDWIHITKKELAKSMRCTEQCIAAHVAVLKKSGILMVEKRSGGRFEIRNFYKIDSASLKDVNLWSFFSVAIRKKVNFIYGITKVDNNYYSLTENNNNYYQPTSHDKSNSLKISKIGASESRSARLRKKAEFKEISVGLNEDSLPEFVTAQKADFAVGESAFATVTHEAEGVNKKTTAAQDMMTIWRRHISKDEQLTKPHARFLVACFQRKFENCLERWEAYVVALKRSRYVLKLRMKWRSILRWALSFLVISKVCEGGFGCNVVMPEDVIVKEEKMNVVTEVREVKTVTSVEVKTVEPEYVESLESMNKRHIEHMSKVENDLCSKIRRFVTNSTFGEENGNEVYHQWLTKIALRESDSLTNGKRTFEVRGAEEYVNKVLRDYLNGKVLPSVVFVNGNRISAKIETGFDCSGLSGSTLYSDLKREAARKYQKECEAKKAAEYAAMSPREKDLHESRWREALAEARRITAERDAARAKNGGAL